MLDKKIVLITGASRGIGAATALKLAQLHYHVCINFKKNKTQADELVRSIQSSGGSASAHRADVSIETEVIALFTEIDNIGRISALVNNVGILKPQQRVIDMSAERINQMLTTNVTSYFVCAREAIKRMLPENDGNGGSIVNVSSAASRLGAPGEYVDYAASKGAIDSFTTGLSLEMASQKIRVNAVRPGFIHTDIHADAGEPNRVNRLSPIIPMKRGGTPEEVANAISWLLSDDASYVTGSFIELAGGK